MGSGIWNNCVLDPVHVEIRSILYIPKRAPADMNMGNTESWKSDIKLYVRRVLIADSFDTLLPRYLMWVRGARSSRNRSVSEIENGEGSRPSTFFPDRI